MAIYRTGQASMDAQGYITGYGTKWREQLTLIRSGATIIFLSNPLQFGVITEVVNDTSMRAITTGGAVVAKTNYIILLHDSLTVDGLAQDVAETLRYYQGKETEFAHFIEFLKDFDFAKLEDLNAQIKESAAAAKKSETNAKASETAAKASQTAAKASETNSKASETAAKASQNAAKTSETNAKASENKAKEYLDQAGALVSPLTQYDWPVITGNENVYVKIATLTDPGSNNCHMTLMVTNGGNYGSTHGNIDFIEISARGLASTITTSNVKTFLQVRRLGSTALDDTNQMRYGLVRAESGLEVWAFQRAFVNGAKVAVLAKTARTNLLIPTGFVKQSTVPAGYVESTAIRIYDTANKPSKSDLGLGTAAYEDVGTASGNVMQVGAFGLGGNGPSTNGKMSDVEILKALRDKGGHFWRADRPTGSTATIYSHGSGIFSRCGDTWSAINIDYATGKVKIYSGNDNGLNSGTFKVNELYGAANKPTKSDVGLSNVTNDAQVKKAGDTMTGDLVVQKGTPSIRVRSVSGNAHLWFENNDGTERGVVWAEPNTADGGKVRIRAKTTGGTTGGDFVVHHNGKIEANASQINGKALSRTIEANNPDTNTAATTVKFTGKQHTPVLIERTGSSSNLSIGFKLDGKNIKRLGVDTDGDLSYGENENQAQNSKVVTLAMLNKDQALGGSYIFSKVAAFNGGFAGFWVAEDLTGKTVDLNTLIIKPNDVGQFRLYKCTSAGGGDKITNKPAGVGGNFLLRVEALRLVSDSDLAVRQVLVNSDSYRQHERFYKNGAWDAWREVVVSGRNQDITVKSLVAGDRITCNELVSNGNANIKGAALLVGGGSASAIPSTDKGIVIAKGSSVRETSDGRLIMASSGGDQRKLSLRPAGANASNNGIEISCTSASAGDTKLAFGQGAAIRCNASGSPIISAKEGQMIYIRPNGDTGANGQVTISSGGTLEVSGKVKATEAEINGGLTATSATIKGAVSSTGSITAGEGFSARGKMCNFGALELYHDLPYIDFHYKSSDSDYTTRIIQDGDNQLSFHASSVRAMNDFTAHKMVRACGGDAFIAWPISDPAGVSGQIRIAPKFQSRFNTAGGPGRTSFWFEEHVGSNHRAVIEVAGYNTSAQYWHFRSDGQIWQSARGDVAWAGTSDLRYKNNVVDYDGLQSLENIKAMNLIKFTYKDDDRNRERRGVAAQQIREIDPCYVKESKGSYVNENGEQVEVDKLVLDTNPLLMDAICAIKALSAQVDELKEEIRKLKGE